MKRNGSGAAQSDAPIVVFGAPRSGTTYLNKVLNAHPDVHITHETCVFVWAHNSLKVLANNDQFLLSQRGEFIDHLKRIYPAMIRGFYHSLKPKARYWGDKHPHYAATQNEGCLETILELFPRARFLHIIRDGRDVVASLIRKKHADGRPWVDFNGAHRIWTSHVDIGCAFGRKLPAEQYHELRYEDLVGDDVNVARTLFKFLAIDMHQSVIEYCQSQQIKRTPLSGPTRDLNDGARGSDWKTLLPEADQLEGLKMIGAHLVRYGYEDAASFVAEYSETAAQLAQSLVDTVPDTCPVADVNELVT